MISTDAYLIFTVNLLPSLNLMGFIVVIKTDKNIRTSVLYLWKMFRSSV